MSVRRVPGGQHTAGLPLALFASKLPNWLARRWRSSPQDKSHKDFTAKLEGLEPRTMLAVSPFISEFMASNANGIRDEFNNTSDWIEVTNPGAAPLNLQGYYLTDDADDLTKWRFPSLVVPAGGRALVWASNQVAPLHTGFELDAAGEYLGLVAPDGTTVLSDFGPTFPQQLSDVSYGIASNLITTPLVRANAAVKVRVPANGNIGTTWHSPAFNDSSWTSGFTGVGYDADVAPPRIPGWTVRMVNFNEGISDVTTATRLLDGDFSGYTVNQPLPAPRDYPAVNHGSGGDYAGDQQLPDGSQNNETYALRATADVFFPAGTWTVAVASDDGFVLKIPGATFTTRSPQNTAGFPTPVPADTLVWSAPRGHAPTFGTFTVPAGGLSTSVRLDFYENAVGDDVEVSIAPGTQTAFNAGVFKLLADGVEPGLTVKTTSSTPAPDFNSIISANVQSAMRNVNASAYARIPLGEVLDPNDFDSLKLRMKYDDGFVAYLNGTKIAERNAPASPTWSSTATASRADAAALVYEDILIELPPGLLQPGVGNNVLAIHGLNLSAGDNDFLVYPELEGVTTLASAKRYFSVPTPGALNNASSLSEAVADTQFSVDRGFYDSPFSVAITTPTQGAQIRYTLDGTTPTETSGTLYSGPVLVDRTSTLRAIAYKPGAIPTNVDTQTYIFLSDVVQQSANNQPPAGWPATWGSNAVDYGMDPSIVNDPRYAGDVENGLKDGLTSIPTMSIVMNLNDLFGGSGIYSNPGNDGRTWERPASLELINPDGSTGFQIDAGIRLRGGFSRSTGNPKHAFRFFFRNEYGAGKLNYPLFGDDPTAATEFDGFDLRTFQNYSWSFQGDGRGIFVRDQLSRDAQLAMGQPGKRGKYYHLYINGQYWGVYNTDERPEASYAGTYFGGQPEDYDVIKPSPDNGYNIYATDGNMAAWTDMWNQVVALKNLGESGGDTHAAYMRLQGLNADGTRNAAFPVHLDVDNLIDYMLVIYYGGNLDAPLSNFLSNVSPNNFFATRNRNGQEGWKFYVHDAEHTLLNAGEDRTGPWHNPAALPALGKSNPQFIFELLADNPEFRLRVADRIHRHMFNDGVLTPAKFTQLALARRDELFAAVVGESARWGDAKREPAFTRDDNWLPQYNGLLNSYIPQRTGTVLNQLSNDGFYPAAPAPEFNQHGGVVAQGFNLSISNPGGQGTVYYTTDGSDPRRLLGAVSGSARVYSGPIALDGTRTIKARVRLPDNSWSALTEALFYFDLSGLRISELMYNPGTNQDLEYVELVNTGPVPLDLAGVEFSQGIEFTFPSMTLAPGARTLVVANQAAFEARYGAGLPIAGQFTDTLSNGGEQLVLNGPGSSGILLDFTYNDTWYPITDGQGYSLVAIDPAADPATLSNRSAWRPSNTSGGLPGQADPGVRPNSVLINEVLPNPAAPGGAWVELHNTTGSEIDLSGWFLSDDPLNLTEYRIPTGTKVAAGGFLVLTQAEHFGAAINMSGAHTDLFLSNNAGTTTLGGYREVVDFAGAAPQVTLGKHVKSTGGTDFVELSTPTPGGANAQPRVGPVVISEFLYHPLPGGHEFIELQNITASAVSLAGWTFNEGVAFTFPAGASIAAQGYALVVPIDPQTFRSLYNVPAGVPIFGPYTLELNDGGENLKLSRPGTPVGEIVPMILVDQVDYDNQGAWPAAAGGAGPSLSRATPTSYGNDAGNWLEGAPGGTPGRAYVPPARPTGLSATSTGGNSIRLTWADNADNETSYRIERSTDNFTFTEVAAVGTNVTSFDDTGLSANTTYYYRVRAQSGAGPSGYSLPASAITWSTQVQNLFDFTGAWRYSQTGAAPAGNWTAPGYNDLQAGWNDYAPGLFYVEDAALPATKSTPLALNSASGRTMTYYFRRTFNIANPSAVSALTLRAILDDGAVIWLNGNPLPALTIGMGAGPYNYGTPAGRTVSDAAIEGPFNLPVSMLVAGTNTIAVQVHQINNTSTDVVWGASLSATLTTVPQSITADIVNVTPDPAPAGPDSITISFSEPVAGFDAGDLRLTRNGGPDLLAGAPVTLNTTDNGRTWVLGNLSRLTFVAGQYNLLLLAGASGVTGQSTARPLTADATESFQVSTTAIAGGSAAEQFQVRVNGSDLEVIKDSAAGVVIYRAPLSDIASLSIAGNGGDDTIELASVLPFAPAITGGAGNDRLSLTAGAHTINAALSASGFESLTVGGSAEVTLGSSQTLSNLTLDGSARLALAPSGDRFLRLSTLSMSDGATLDLADGGLVVQAASAAQRDQVLQLLHDRIASARNFGATRWGGVGLTSSTAASAARRTLGLSPNASGAGSPLFTTLYGSPVDANAVIVKYTHDGDANLDGRVNISDFFVTDAGKAMRRTGFASGDFDYSGGTADADDYMLIDRAFLGQPSGLSVGAPAAAAPAALPAAPPSAPQPLSPSDGQWPFASGESDEDDPEVFTDSSREVWP